MCAHCSRRSLLEQRDRHRAAEQNDTEQTKTVGIAHYPGTTPTANNRKPITVIMIARSISTSKAAVKFVNSFMINSSGSDAKYRYTI